MKRKGCNIAGCEYAYYAKGLCRSHYKKLPINKEKQYYYDIAFRKKRLDQKLNHKAIYSDLLRFKYLCKLKGVVKENE